MSVRRARALLFAFPEDAGAFLPRDAARPRGVALMGSRAIVGVAVTIVLAACAAGTAPSSVPSDNISSPEPAVTASAAADPVAEILAECAEAESPEGAPVELVLRAENFAFTTERLEGPRHCEPFTITLYNADPAAEHNVAIEPIDQEGSRIFAGELIGPRRSTTYEIPALPAGEYRFLCAPHSGAMNGVLVVAAGD